MAPLLAQALPICRSCLRTGTPPLRSFSTNPPRRKALKVLPTFHSTSSPDLDALLSTFRSNVFIPNHLPRAQRLLIYKKKNHHLLTADEPATASIGEEIVTMRPIDRTKDEPDTRSTIAKILELMPQAGNEAWDNLPGFLMGLKTAKRRLKGWQVEKIVRRACTAKKEGLIMQCVYMVERTGLGLWELGAVREMMWAAVRRAEESGWSKKGVERGLKFAEGVWMLMQDPRHLVPRNSILTDPMSRPEVVGVLVQLQAAQAVMFNDNNDEGGKVAEYSNILLALWPKDGAEVALGEDSDWHEANQKAVMWAPVAHGMKLARQVLGPESDMGREFGAKLEKELEPLLTKARDLLSTKAETDVEEERSRRGIEALKLVGIQEWTSSVG